MVEINYLCVHKKLRTKRLAPVLIKEITRRVHLQNIFQATYTAGIRLPRPVSACQYYHRNLNPKKLIETGFSHLPRNSTLAALIKKYKLPENTLTPGLRPLQAKDVKDVATLLSTKVSCRSYIDKHLISILVPKKNKSSRSTRLLRSSLPKKSPTTLSLATASCTLM